MLRTVHGGDGREGHVSEGGDPACWLDRTCPACGHLDDGPVPAVCPQCGRARRDDEVGDDPGVVRRVQPVDRVEPEQRDG